MPGSGCNHSKPINEKVKSGATSVRFTQPVKIAPIDSKKHSNPKIILKTINDELSICLKNQ
ncbi:hypothetical protein GCM10023311_20270 [Flaviramulus aquimarinus]|uniref:Uncharacterized protein n=1 Tax=Flaviramulus aquimarinus TaxID=1170456 RepID=A0ABP9F963_9FLAO